MPMTDTDFRAEGDAHTLAEAAAIKADKKRLAAAQKAAAKMAPEQSAKARALGGLARKLKKRKPAKAR